MNTRERISLYLSFKGITDYSFEKNLGLSKGYLYKCKNPTSKMLDKLCSFYPDISAEWLLRGEGPMLREEKGVINVDASETNITDNTAPVTIGHNSTVSANDLAKVISTLEKTIEQQQNLITKLIEKI